MLTVRLSPSKIEQFRKYYENAMNGFITEQMVIDSILGVKEYKPALDFGTAYHAVLENGASKYYNNGKYEIFERGMQEPIILNHNEVKLADEFHTRYSEAIHECSNVLHLNTSKIHFQVPMRIDMMYGNEVHENKTTSRPIDMEDYMKSYQWQFYCVATKSPFVQYNIFQYKKLVNDIEYKIDEVNFKFYPHSDIKNDVISMAKLTYEFCCDNNIQHKIIVPNDR